MNKKPMIFLIFTLAVGATFLFLLFSVLEMKTYYIDMNEEITFSQDTETTYMVLVDDMFQEVDYNITSANNESYITYPIIPGYRIGYTMTVDLDEGFFDGYIVPYGTNTTITVNEYDGIGTIVLPAGEITIEFTPETAQTTDMADSFHFALIPSNMIVMIIFTVFTGMGTGIFFVVFLITRSQANKQFEMDPYGYDDNTYDSTHSNDQDLFDMNDDDVFAQYNNKKRNRSRWDD